MRKMMMIGVAFAAASILAGTSAFAVDQFVLGKKLLIKNPPSGTTNNKVVYLSKDPITVVPGAIAEDPRCVPDGGSGAGGSLRVRGLGGDVTIPLACANWSVLGSGAYKYKDITGSTCKILMVKGGKLVKAVCKGSQIAYNLGASQLNIVVALSTGTTPRRWCSGFNGTTRGCDVAKDGSDDKTYISKNCTSAGSSCSPSGAFIETASLF